MSWVLLHRDRILYIDMIYIIYFEISGNQVLEMYHGNQVRADICIRAMTRDDLHPAQWSCLQIPCNIWKTPCGPWRTWRVSVQTRRLLRPIRINMQRTLSSNCLEKHTEFLWRIYGKKQWWQAVHARDFCGFLVLNWSHADKDELDLCEKSSSTASVAEAEFATKGTSDQISKLEHWIHVPCLVANLEA